MTVLETIARAYHGDHQVVNAIEHDKGGDDLAREKKALHFGIRKHCVPYNDSEGAEEPSGVEKIQRIDCEGGKGLAIDGLRYGKP
jgi:hypothetical protein